MSPTTTSSVTMPTEESEELSKRCHDICHSLKPRLRSSSSCSKRRRQRMSSLQPANSIDNQRRPEMSSSTDCSQMSSSVHKHITAARPSLSLSIIIISLLVFIQLAALGLSSVSVGASAAAAAASDFRRIVDEFRADDIFGVGHHNLSNIAVDDATDRLYVAGTNVLYQLDDKLRLRHKVETGPVLDSHLCGTSGCDHQTDAVPTDNYNKILVLDTRHGSALLACGTVRQGLCVRYAGEDISRPSTTLGEAVAANRPDASSYGFIGPANYGAWADSRVLYVGTTFTDHGDYRHDVPAIASRNLHNLRLAEFSFSKQSMVKIDTKYRGHFLVDYVYGFNSTRHVYFVTVQKKSYLPGESEAGYITRISRACVNDSNFDTYSEVTLQCEVGGDKYNLVQDAFLAPGSSFGRSRLHSSADSDHVLVGVFAASDGSTSKPRPGSQSAVCAYSLEYIDRLFDENIHMCFNGSMQSRGLPYISGPVDEGKCPSVGSAGNILDFCETAIKISGPRPVPQQVGQLIPARYGMATSITVARVGHGRRGVGGASSSSAAAGDSFSSAPAVVGIVGTDTGHVVKLLLLMNSGRSEIVDSFIGAEGEPILPGTRMHSNNVDLLILTPRRLRRVKIADCRRHHFCGECLGRRDPFCGWCSLENECTTIDNCPAAADFAGLSSSSKSSMGSRGGPPAWLTIGSSHQCVQLEAITPGWISVDDPHTNISLQISSLPELPRSSDYYQCVYSLKLLSSGSSAISSRLNKAGSTRGSLRLDASLDSASSSVIVAAMRATKVPGGLVCPTPPLDKRPVVPPPTGDGAASTSVLLVDHHKKTPFGGMEDDFGLDGSRISNSGLMRPRDHVTMSLAVTLHSRNRGSGSNSLAASKEFVSTSVMVFNCETHSTCYDCVSARWPCAWCSYSNKCTHLSSHSANSCPDAIVSSDTSVFQMLQDNPSQVISHGTDLCPRVTPQQLFVPDSVPQELSLSVTHLPLGLTAVNSPAVTFLCEVEIEAAKLRVSARYNANSGQIVCEKTSYSYESSAPMYNASITLLWRDGGSSGASSNNKIMDNILDRTNITLYKCGLVGSYRGHADCSLCMTRTADLGCVWCGSGCAFAASCPATSQSETCPRPRIDVVRPLSGPVDGGTVITIEGSNLAISGGSGTSDLEHGDGGDADKNFRQWRNKVSIGGVPCRVTDYQVGVRIECRTGPSPGRREADLPVQLYYNDNNTGKGFVIESAIKFRYRDFAVTGLSPSFGPASGGTVLTVEGSNLNIGSSVSVLMDSALCEVNLNQVTSTRLTCVTPAAPAGGPSKVNRLSVIIDDAQRQLMGSTNGGYTYTPDPTIIEVEPKWSFVSGGRLLTVHGRYLNTVEQPFIAALDDRGVGVGRAPCTVVSSTKMECPSPAIVASPAAQLTGGHATDNEDDHDLAHAASYNAVSFHHHPHNSPEIQTFRIGFEMDRVRSLLNLEASAPELNSELLYVEDPVYYKFPNNEKVYYRGSSGNNDVLVIEGANLNLAAAESDLDVRVGQGRCNVTSLTATQLLCVPPADPPPPVNPSVNSGPEVVVYVGRNLKFEIGGLVYEFDDAGYYSAFAIPPEVIGGIGAAAALTLFIAIGFLIVYKHKSSQAEREYKRIQIQMDTLENNVRSECKQAFAELQTDMTDLTMDLEVSGIPLLDHRTFVVKVFFPGIGEAHPLFTNAGSDGVGGAGAGFNGRATLGQFHFSRGKSDLDAAMVQFEQLINNRCFLLALIETMERQKTFTIRDRVNFASLLMIVLMTKMEYCTDILRTLLLKLIERSLTTKHPQLMLLKTESIVEKMMTNWLALCLYDYMKDYAGSSLFVLFKAIKFQIEKGPVDAITQEARYSLSEDKLLRETVSANTVVCCVVQEELEEEVVVRVLDCDSISQVKSKILDALYKNTPFSLRPAVDEVDLEWRCGQYTQLGTTGGQLVLQDIDITSKVEANGMRKLNTLAHYGVKEKAVVSLVPKQALDSPAHHIYQAVSVVGRDSAGGAIYGPSPTPNGGGAASLYNYPVVYPTNHRSGAAAHHIYSPLSAVVGGKNGSSGSPVPLGSPPSSSSVTASAAYLQDGSYYHLVRPEHLPTDAGSHERWSASPPHMSTAGGSGSAAGSAAATRSHKSIPEIFLTRLLSTKGTIQKFVDDFFGTILKVPSIGAAGGAADMMNGGAAGGIPLAVKWLFDLLDDAASQNNVTNPEILHAWKSNCLPLRFWVNFIKNPDFIFDINKTVTSDSCLSVIAQTFMDSCSLSENIIGKDSPSSKLLFAKDIPLYRQLVMEYYSNIQNLPQVSDQELNYHMQRLSASHLGEFDSMAALKELYLYVSKYYGELMASLDDSPAARQLHLGHRLKAVAQAVYPQEMSAPTSPLHHPQAYHNHHHHHAGSPLQV